MLAINIKLLIFLFSALSMPLFCQKKIYILGTFYQNEWGNGLFKNHIYEELNMLQDALNKKGYSLETPTHPNADLSDAEYIIFFNGRYPLEKITQYPKKKCILLVFEPPATFPYIHTKKYQENFSKVFTWETCLIDNKKYFHFFYSYPSTLSTLEPVIPFEQRKLCTLVATSQILKHDKRELYSERARVISFFEQLKTNEFDLWGNNWDKSLSCYKGPIPGGVAAKIALIRNYKFYICYENMCDINGYITEKIFNCFQAGTVPIYWGASDITDFIPADCFIDRRNFKNTAELYAFIKSISAPQYQTYLNNIKKFLKSELRPFCYETFVDELMFGLLNEN